MKQLYILILFFCLPVCTVAQHPLFAEPTKDQADSMLLMLENTSNDTLRMAMCRDLTVYYMETNRDSALIFCEQRLNLAKKLKLKLWEAEGYENLGYLLYGLGNYTKALEAFLNAIKIAKDEASEKNIWQLSKFTNDENPRNARLAVLANIHHDFGHLYGHRGTNNIEMQLYHYTITKQMAEALNEYTLLSLVNMNLSEAFLNHNKLDTSLAFGTNALAYADSSGYKKYKGLILSNVGNVYTKKGMYDSAKKYLYQAEKMNLEQNNLAILAYCYVSLANSFSKTAALDSSLYYAQKGRELYEAVDEPYGVFQAYNSLFKTYQLRNNIDSAYKYQSLAMMAKDSLENLEKIKRFQNIEFNEQLRLRELEEERIKTQNKIRTYAMLTGIGVFMAIAFLLYRNNRNRKKANELLQKQKEEIEVQKKNIEGTLIELKATQFQLIQSEKMASLGELTAGIAHEIQNPLNFVNNFSEVNTELIDELKTELRADNKKEAFSLAEDIKQIEQKIIHHGKRADAIVKGMLQHSRRSTGEKEPTDINALVDEYLRLSFHGLRAKDRSFNAMIKTHFDSNIEKINVVPQDIGRVLLNLFNNAFYAVSERGKTGGEGYEPEVSVNTIKEDDKVIITVNDNGIGISQKVIDKIFQPFFTTKPTGQGTGLGLSLSYDIIKAHGGEIKVESKEGEGTSFLIRIPVL